MSMALQVFTDVMALIWQHPFFSCLVLLLFTPPFFPIVKFFSPLLISTALFMIALFTMDAQSGTATESQQGEENWEFRRPADVKVWEDKSVGDGERGSKLRRKPDGNWMDWLSSVQEAGLSWIETKFRNENWKGSALNDDNVSILQEASWAKNDPSLSGVSTIEEEVVITEGRVPAVLAPSMLFRVDSKLKELALEKSFEVVNLGDDTPGLEDVVEEPEQVPATFLSLKHASSVHHEPLGNLQISKEAAAIVTTIESPSTDLDDSSDLERSRRLFFSTVRRNSMNASSGLSVASESDVDTPAPVLTLSKSGKLKHIETLGDLIEEKEHAGKTGEELPTHELEVLKPTTAEQVDAVKDKLEGFTHGSGEVKTEKPVNASSSNPEEGSVKKTLGSPLFKEAKGTGKNVKKSSAFSDDDSSSGEEELSDSDSDSEFEIFPPVDPKKMKLHPPVKLDIQQLEKKLGTSLSQRTRATPPKGEITEVQ